MATPRGLSTARHGGPVPSKVIFSRRDDGREASEKDGIQVSWGVRIRTELSRQVTGSRSLSPGGQSNTSGKSLPVHLEMPEGVANTAAEWEDLPGRTLVTCLSPNTLDTKLNKVANFDLKLGKLVYNIYSIYILPFKFLLSF